MMNISLREVNIESPPKTNISAKDHGKGYVKINRG